MIQELLSHTHLTHQEKAVVTYLYDHPQCLLTLNAKELAKQSYVSSPTIIRLVKKLGFQGFHEFQLAYVREYMQTQQHQSYALTSQSTMEEIMQTLPHIYQQVLEETKHLIHKETFVRTINYIMQASQIDFYANDHNYSQIQSACLKLTTLGFHTQAFNTLNQHYVDTIAQPQNVLSFVVSHSGKNQTMVDVAHYLRKKHIRVIAITGIFDPTLQLVCHESLYIDASSHQLPHYLMLYGLSIQYIIDILVLALSVKKEKL